MEPNQELVNRITELQQQLKAATDSKMKRKLRKQIRKYRAQAGVSKPTTTEPKPTTPRERKPKKVIEPAPDQPIVLPEGLQKVTWDKDLNAYCFAGPEKEIPNMITKFTARWGKAPTWYAEVPVIGGYAFGPVPTTPWISTHVPSAA